MEMKMGKAKEFFDLVSECQSKVIDDTWEYILSISQNPWDAQKNMEYLMWQIQYRYPKFKDWLSRELTKKAQTFCEKTCAGCTKFRDFQERQ